MRVPYCFIVQTAARALVSGHYDADAALGRLWENAASSLPRGCSSAIRAFRRHPHTGVRAAY